MKFTLYFEFFGSLMKTTVEANSLSEAKEMVRSRVNFIDSVQPSQPKRKNSDPTVNHLKDIFGMFD